MSLMTAANLAVGRAGKAVLQDLSFDLSPGEAIVLHGPNGIGKSTLLRCLSGLQPAFRGQIDVAEDQIVYCGHSDGLKSALSLQENLQFWAQVYDSPQPLPDILARFKLTEIKDRRAAHLSAGQKRRLGLARTCIAGRQIWLLDEPTVSLDSTSVTLFAAIIHDHLAAGGGAIIATHLDLGLGAKARVLDLTPHAAKSPGAGGTSDAFDEAFL